MSGQFVSAVSDKAHPDCHCHQQTCHKKNCSISMQGGPTPRVIVDLDCRTLEIPRDRKLCDYLFVGEENNTAWVAPIELKGGRFKADEVVEQLQGGANVANTWLPSGNSFKFVPVLVHGPGVHKKDYETLRRRKIRLHGREGQTVLIRCGNTLREALDKAL